MDDDGATSHLLGLKVLLVGINYTPETTGIAPYTAALADALTTAGAEVRVITGVPHYPQWKPADGYRCGLRWRETIDGVSVLRLRHWVPRRTGLVGRGLMEATFLAMTVPAILRDRSTVIVAVTPSLSAVGASVVARRGRALGVIVQDLVGNGAAQSGTTGGRAARAIAAVEYWLLRRAVRVGVIAEAFADVLQGEGIPEARIVDVANFSRTDRAEVSTEEARRLLGWPTDRFIVAHTGNVGMKQGLDLVVDAARLAEASGSDTLFMVVGDGNQRPQLQASAKGIRSIRFVEPLSEEQYPLALAAADVLLLCERPGALEMSLPSKLTSYVAAGKPILAAVPTLGITHEFVTQHGIAHTIEAGNPDALLSGLAELRSGLIDERQLVENCERTLHREYEPTTARRRYQAFVNTLVAPANGQRRSEDR